MAFWKNDHYMIAIGELIKCEEMKKKKEEAEQAKECIVEFDGRHEYGWCIKLGPMVVSRYNDKEQAEAWCRQLNDRMQFRR